MQNPAMTTNLSPLGRDSRTLWAYRRFTSQRDPGAIDDGIAARILDLIGDRHVEAIFDAAIEPGRSAVFMNNIRRRAGAPAVAVRTLSGWYFIDRGTATVTTVPGPGSRGIVPTDPATDPWPDSGVATRLLTEDGRDLGVRLFLDDSGVIDGVSHGNDDIRLITEGAGPYIRRLPESAAVPPLPDVGARPRSETTTGNVVLPADWRTVEEIAREHMRAIGFPDARLTGGGRDSGIDVTAASGVAQVKMLALPVGGPAVQQLRGARPLAAHHLFYATSGYTRAATETAAEIGVCLFTVGRDGTVTAVNAAARMLESSGVADGEAGEERPDLTAYVQGVRDRVGRAVRTVAATDVSRLERFPDHEKRALRYLAQARRHLAEDRTFATPRSEAVHFHHAELLAHVWFAEFAVDYPEKPAAPVDDLDRYYD